MVFYALTSAGSRVRRWNPSLKSEGFNPLDGPSRLDVNASERTCLIVFMHHTTVSIVQEFAKEIKNLKW